MMITFITGNQHKADYLAKYLGIEIGHQKIDLDELQSLDLKKIVEHKVKQAYDIVGGPVIVEDISLGFEALGGLPGPFIKFFVEHVPYQTICDMIQTQNRHATASCVFGYYDGSELVLLEGSLDGEIATKPGGEHGFGRDWDKIFIPKGHTITRSEMSEDDYKKTYLQIKPLKQLKEFLEHKFL